MTSSSPTSASSMAGRNAGLFPDCGCPFLTCPMISERRNGELYLSDGDWKRQAHYYSSVSSELETVNFSCYTTRNKEHSLVRRRKKRRIGMSVGVKFYFRRHAISFQQKSGGSSHSTSETRSPPLAHYLIISQLLLLHQQSRRR